MQRAGISDLDLYVRVLKLRIIVHIIVHHDLKYNPAVFVGWFST